MGQTSIILVIGFNVVFAIMSFSLSRVAIDAYDNYVSYYERSVARQIASSGANIVASQISFTPNWRTGYSNVPLSGGTFSATVSDLDSGRIQVNVQSTYMGNTFTEVIVMGKSTFSKFAYYSLYEGSINWTTGDTVWGPFHSQDKLTINGNPVFWGKVTSKKGMTKTSGSKPEFNGGFQSGVSIDLPGDFSNLSSLAQANGKYFNNVGDIYLQFNSDGTATYSIGSWTTTPTTVSLTTLAPNGILYVNKGNLHVKGVVQGQMTIVAASNNSGSSKGNVWIDSSVVYNTNPLTDASSTDMLGIVSDYSIHVTDNTNNHGSSGVTIQASMLSRLGGLTVENYGSWTPAGMPLNVLGGIQQYQRGPVGTINNNGVIQTGFLKRYRYDNRLLTTSPPQYPNTGSFEILSWYE